MKRYADPYVAGFCLGLVLLASFAVVGRGVGVSGAFVWSAAALAAAFDSAVESGSSIAAALQTFGIMLGGLASALLAGRFKFTMESRTRLATAFAGGAVMGVGAYLARGCTSGLALSGGALLGAGSWIFMLAAFAAAYAFAPLVRKAWH
jgi:uncharacterized membrane protein YedE/YeeE